MLAFQLLEMIPYLQILSLLLDQQWLTPVYCHHWWQVLPSATFHWLFHQIHNNGKSIAYYNCVTMSWRRFSSCYVVLNAPITLLTQLLWPHYTHTFGSQSLYCILHQLALIIHYWFCYIKETRKYFSISCYKFNHCIPLWVT